MGAWSTWKMKTLSSCQSNRINDTTFTIYFKTIGGKLGCSIAIYGKSKAVLLSPVELGLLCSILLLALCYQKCLVQSLAKANWANMLLRAVLRIQPGKTASHQMIYITKIHRECSMLEAKKVPQNGLQVSNKTKLIATN